MRLATTARDPRDAAAEAGVSVSIRQRPVDGGDDDYDYGAPQLVAPRRSPAALAAKPLSPQTARSPSRSREAAAVGMDALDATLAAEAAAAATPHVRASPPRAQGARGAGAASIPPLAALLEDMAECATEMGAEPMELPHVAPPPFATSTLSLAAPPLPPPPSYMLPSVGLPPFTAAGAAGDSTTGASGSGSTGDGGTSFADAIRRVLNGGTAVVDGVTVGAKAASPSQHTTAGARPFSTISQVVAALGPPGRGTGLSELLPGFPTYAPAHAPTPPVAASPPQPLVAFPLLTMPTIPPPPPPLSVVPPATHRVEADAARLYCLGAGGSAADATSAPALPQATAAYLRAVAARSDSSGPSSPATSVPSLSSRLLAVREPAVALPGGRGSVGGIAVGTNFASASDVAAAAAGTTTPSMTDHLLARINAALLTSTTAVDTAGRRQPTAFFSGLG